MYFNLFNVEGAQRVQVGRVASDKGPLLTAQVFQSWGFIRNVHHCTDFDPHSDPENPE